MVKPLSEEDGASAPAPGGTFVQSLDRGLAVIRAFDADHPTLQLSEVARLTGLTRAVARRYLLTLVQLGYVRQEGREFSLRPRILELGYSYLSSHTLPEIAQPHLEHFVAAVGESSSVSVRDGDDVVYVARVPTKRIMAVVISVGTRFPAYATSLGRALLAGLPDDQLSAYLERVDIHPRTPGAVGDAAALRKVLDEVRDAGYAIVDQELEVGLRSAAAPIYGRGASVVAAINVSVSASRTSVEELRERIVPQLIETAARISSDLRHA